MDLLQLYWPALVSAVTASIAIVVVAGFVLSWIKDEQAKVWIRRIRTALLVLTFGALALSFITGASVHLVPRSTIDRSLGEQEHREQVERTQQQP